MAINSQVRDYIIQLIQKEINKKRQEIRDRNADKIGKAVDKWKRTTGKKALSLALKEHKLHEKVRKLNKEHMALREEAVKEIKELGYDGYISAGLSDFAAYYKTGLSTLMTKVENNALPQDEVKALNDMVGDLNTRIMLALNITAIRKAVAAVNEYLGTNIELE